ncbi:MAG: class F sortase [Dehalococcoidia bacterium]
MVRNRLTWAIAGILATLLLATAWVAWPLTSGGWSQDAAAAQSQPRDLATQLRYIGRDGLTGMPAPVDDRFIADHEEAIDQYGEVEHEAVPPPPVDGADIAAIRVADIGIDATMGRYGVDKFGRLDVPQDRVTVGWNPGYSALPGEGGATFFAAHYEYGGVPGVFFRLSSLAPGAEVDVALTDGTNARYRVTSTIDYPLGSIDMGALLDGMEGRESVTLMTCSGPPNEGEYPLRTVVLAERIT